MTRVLLTGAAGFVGGHCVTALLKRGFEVHAVSRNSHHASDVEWHQAELLDIEQARRVLEQTHPHYLLHLAWFVVPGEYWTSMANLPWVAASLSLVRLFGAIGGDRAVLVGSGAEYDPRFDRCIEGQTPIRPASIYGATKASVGMLLPWVASTYGVESSAWARLFYVFGPGEHRSRLVPSTIQALLRGERMRSTSGAQVRDPLYIEDAADALVSLLESSVTGEVNIGTGCGVSLQALLGRLGRMLARESLLDLDTHVPRQGEPHAQVADVTRLSTEVGWRPAFTLDEGLEHTIAWWRKELASIG